MQIVLLVGLQVQWGLLLLLQQQLVAVRLERVDWLVQQQVVMRDVPVESHGVRDLEVGG